MDDTQAVNLSEQEAIRREKLAALQAAGNDPFRALTSKRTARKFAPLTTSLQARRSVSPGA